LVVVLVGLQAGGHAAGQLLVERLPYLRRGRGGRARLGEPLLDRTRNHPRLQPRDLHAEVRQPVAHGSGGRHPQV
jgi:hypothetical protein